MIEVESFGNVFAAVCMLHGVAADEVPREKLAAYHPMYPVTIAVRAIKRSSP